MKLILVNVDHVSSPPLVAFLGTRFQDFDVEREILGDVRLVSGPGASPTEITNVAGEADVILSGAAPRFDRDTLQALRCRGIVRLGVGVDTVDLPTAESLGMTIAYVPDYGTEAVALHALSLVLAALRRIPQADRIVGAGGWGISELRPLHLPAALIAGVVGYGRIGRRVTQLLHGLGFGTILTFDPVVDDEALEPFVQSVDLERLLDESDVVTLHAPPPPSGWLLGAKELARMKQGSILVNTARGALVDTQALVDALPRNRPGLAALDVFESEPPDAETFARLSESVILTPHMAWYTEETELDLRRGGAEAARRILEGETPRHVVVTGGARSGRTT